jgi:hypothetical protein
MHARMHACTRSACHVALLLRPDALRARAQFALTLGRASSRDDGGSGGGGGGGGAHRRCTVFGRLIRGYGLLRHLEALPTRADGAPLSLVRAHTRTHTRTLCTRVTVRILAPPGSVRQQVLIAACGELGEADDGVVLAPDGDPFPAWPQDHPGLSGDGPGAAYEARAAAAETLRAFGNEAFKKGDFAAADAKYTKALRYLEHTYTREAETLHEEAAARRTQVALSVPLLLNAAAARLRLRDGRGAVAACDAVAELEDDALSAALGVAKSKKSGGAEGAMMMSGNAKALFRRGAGLALCREFEAAERDLERAAALAPGDAAVARELGRVRAAAAARRGRERAAFAAAFAAGGDR